MRGWEEGGDGNERMNVNCERNGERVMEGEKISALDT